MKFGFDWWPSWSYDLDHLNKLLFANPTEVSHEMWLRLAQPFPRCLKMVDDDDISGACLYYMYKLTHEPKGSGELKRYLSHRQISPA